MTEKIRIYRQYRTYRVINARSIEVNVRYYMWVPDKVEHWVYPLPGYLPDLDVKSSNGTKLPVLSDDEINNVFRSRTKKDLDIQDENVTQEKLHSFVKAQKSSTVKQAVQENEKKAPHYVVILLQNDIEGGYFEEVTVQWIRPIEVQQKSDYGFSLHVSEQIEIEPSTTSSTYIDLQMDGEKYNFRSTPEIKGHDSNRNECKINNNKEYKQIFNDKERFVFRTKRHCEISFTAKFSIGIPYLVRAWAWAGCTAAFAVIAFSLISFAFDQSYSTFYLNARLLAGLAALIVALRALLFHDFDLMNRWHHLFLWLLGISITLILIMGIIQSGPESLPPEIIPAPT